MRTPTRTRGTRRAELLEAAADWVLEHGLTPLTLRALADDLGTSDRMLVYHFGTKEALLEALVEAVNGRLLATLARPLAATERPSQALAAMWAAAQADEMRPYLRFFADLSAIGVREPGRYAEAARATFDAWAPLVERSLAASGVAEDDRRGLGVALASMLYGLALDSLLLGGRADADEAVEVLGRLLDARATNAAR